MSRWFNFLETRWRTYLNHSHFYHCLLAARSCALLALAEPDEKLNSHPYQLYLRPEANREKLRLFLSFPKSIAADAACLKALQPMRLTGGLHFWRQNTYAVRR
jgi:hypothetical protein